MQRPHKLVNASVIANRYGVSPDTVVRWARERRVPCVRPSRRVLRFCIDDVDAALFQPSGTDEQPHSRGADDA